MNSEMACAWISEINPNQDNTFVDITFVLPSGFIGKRDPETDEFTKTFEIPSKHLPDELPFKKFIESCGCHSVTNLSEIVGTRVPTEFNDRTSEWEIDLDLYPPVEEDTSGRGNEKEVQKRLKSSNGAAQSRSNTQLLQLMFEPLLCFNNPVTASLFYSIPILSILLLPQFGFAGFAATIVIVLVSIEIVYLKMNAQGE